MTVRAGAGTEHGGLATCRCRLPSAALTLAWVLASCTVPSDAGPTEHVLASGVHMREIRSGVWLHVSEQDGVPTNGLLVEAGDRSVLIDTAWNKRQTQEILAFAAGTLHRPVHEAVVTHAHSDRLGGISALHDTGVLTHGLTHTLERAPEYELTPPQRAFSPGPPVRLAGGVVEAYFPGPGHTPDNVVVWVPDAGVLFGGCLVRSGSDASLGYLGDADLQAWPESVRRVLSHYAEAEVVVPGHGPVGGRAALTHTLELLGGAGRPASRAAGATPEPPR